MNGQGGVMVWWWGGKGGDEVSQQSRGKGIVDSWT